MRRVLASRDFRLLWLSQAASNVGDSLVLVVLALYVNDIGTPTDVGVVLAAQAIPLVALLLIGGVWADRLPRHLVMVVSDGTRAGLHVLLAALIIIDGSVPIWAIAAIEAGFGAAEAFFRPAYTGLIPQTVDDELLTEAQAVTQITQNVTAFAGPALGSAVYLAFGAAEAFLADAATFVISALLLLRVRPRERGERAPRQSLAHELAGGWRELRARPWAGLMIAGACVILLVMIAPYEALGPAIADKGYDQAAVYGVLAAATGLGALPGSLLALRWRPKHKMVLAWLMFVPFCLALVAFAAGVTLWLTLPLTVLAGGGFGLFGVWWETALAVEIPPTALSRVSAWDWMGSLGLLPIGFLLAGPVGEAIGVQTTLLAGSVLALLITLGVGVALTRPGAKTPRGTPARV